MKTKTIKATPKTVTYNSVDSAIMYSKTKQIGYVVNTMIKGKGIWSTTKIVQRALGLEYIKKTDTKAGHFIKNDKPLADFAKLFKMTGSELYQHQKEQAEMNNNYADYGLNVTSKEFKAIMRDTTAKPKKKQAFKAKVKNANNKLSENEMAEQLIGLFGKDKLIELLKGAK